MFQQPLRARINMVLVAICQQPLRPAIKLHAIMIMMTLYQQPLTPIKQSSSANDDIVPTCNDIELKQGEPHITEQTQK